MTKPHEETWTWAPQYQHVETPEGGDIGIFVDDRILDPSEKARLVLAAQAPAMARVLLSMLADRATDDWQFRGSEEETEIKDVLRAAGILP